MIRFIEQREGVVTQGVRQQIAGEYSHLAGDSGETALEALRIAIYVEDALGITLPSSMLDAEHLGSPEALERTLAAVLEET